MPFVFSEYWKKAKALALKFIWKIGIDIENRLLYVAGGNLHYTGWLISRSFAAMASVNSLAVCGTKLTMI